MSRNRTGEILDLQLLKRVLLYARPYKLHFIIAAISAILLSVLGPIRPLLINYTVDNFIIIPNQKKLLDFSILIFSLLILEGVIQFFYIYLSTWIGQHVIQDIRSNVYKHILSLRMRYFDNTPIGNLVTRTIADVETISDIFSQGILVIIAELLKLIVVVLLMFYTDWKLAIISMLTIPVLIFATGWFKRNIKAAFQQVRQKVSDLNTFVQEHIVGMHIVQIFNRENAEYKKFKAINGMHRDAHLKSIFYYAVFFPIVEVLSAISIAMIIWYGGKNILLLQGITVGEIIAFILYIHMMFRPIRQLADRFNILQMGIVGSSRVFKVLDNNDYLKSGGLIIEDFRTDIIFKNVNFSYKKDQLVLNNLSFTIPSGKLFAIVGETGAGKTSIINLISRFYDIQDGEIKINDINILDFNLEFLRNNIALIQQDVFLFSDTIYNNITLYDNTISEDQVVEAAKDIGVHDFINRLPNKYDFIVGERGVTLSSGQRQLIAFLRVFIRNPKILILDEATSSIDSTSEKAIQEAMQKISQNRTTIVIAHRLSTIVDADKIICLKKGKLVEMGTHKDLINMNGYYYNLYNNMLRDNNS